MIDAKTTESLNKSAKKILQGEDVNLTHLRKMTQLLRKAWSEGTPGSRKTLRSTVAVEAQPIVSMAMHRLAQLETVNGTTFGLFFFPVIMENMQNELATFSNLDATPMEDLLGQWIDGGPKVGTSLHTLAQVDGASDEDLRQLLLALLQQNTLPEIFRDETVTLQFDDPAQLFVLPVALPIEAPDGFDVPLTDLIPPFPETMDLGELLMGNLQTRDDGWEIVCMITDPTSWEDCLNGKNADLAMHQVHQMITNIYNQPAYTEGLSLRYRVHLTWPTTVEPGTQPAMRVLLDWGAEASPTYEHHWGLPIPTHPDFAPWSDILGDLMHDARELKIDHVHVVQATATSNGRIMAPESSSIH